MDYESASDTNKSLIDKKRFAKEHSGTAKKKKLKLGELISNRLQQWASQPSSSQKGAISRKDAINAAMSDAKKRKYK